MCHIVQPTHVIHLIKLRPTYPPSGRCIRFEAALTACSGAARGLVILFADAAMLGKDFKVEKLMTCVCSVK